MTPVVFETQVTDGHKVTLLTKDECQNPDCPGKDSDLAKAAPHH
jgi:hypothetical protein